MDCYHRMDFAYQCKNPPTKLAAMASASNAAITNNQDPRLADSGKSDYLTANLNNLAIQSQYKGPEQVTVGNGQTLPINHIGNTTIHTKYHNFMLRNVLHVPKIAMNLPSVHKFCLHNNCSWIFNADELKIQDIPMGRLLYKIFKQFCSSHGIVHQLSCAHTPQQNKVAKRKHRHLVECALAISLSTIYCLLVLCYFHSSTYY